MDKGANRELVVFALYTKYLSRNLDVSEYKVVLLAVKGFLVLFLYYIYNVYMICMLYVVCLYNMRNRQVGIDGTMGASPIP